MLLGSIPMVWDTAFVLASPSQWLLRSSQLYPCIEMTTWIRVAHNRQHVLCALCLLVLDLRLNVSVVEANYLSTWLQAAFAKWTEGQKDRPKQVNAALEAHKARVAAAAAAAQQQTQPLVVKPVPKGKKEQPLELHPDQFVRIKAVQSPGAADAPADALVQETDSPAVDVEVSATGHQTDHEQHCSNLCPLRPMQLALLASFGLPTDTLLLSGCSSLLVLLMLLSVAVVF